MYLPTLRALSSPNARDPAAAIQALQIASRYDLALGGVGFIGRFGGLYLIYMRGLAYLAARQPAEAVGEFQRILDHRGFEIAERLRTSPGAIDVAFVRLRRKLRSLIDAPAGLPALSRPRRSVRR